jgi:N-acetylglucosamine-6-sulfatase
MTKPNFLVILIDDLRYDEFGAGGHPYMKTPHIDRIAHEGALFERAFTRRRSARPTARRSSPASTRAATASSTTSRAMRSATRCRTTTATAETRLSRPRTSASGTWATAACRARLRLLGELRRSRSLNDPRLNHDGKYVEHRGYITDIMNELAVDFLDARARRAVFAFLRAQGGPPDAAQAADGSLDLAQQGGYRVAERHKDLYRGCVFPAKPNMLPHAEVVKQKPAWTEVFELRRTGAKAVLDALKAGQEEIRLRAAMMASVDEGVGAILELLERQGRLDNTCIVFLGDNGYFFGEHGLGPERRFAYEEGIRSPFAVRYSRRVKAGSRVRDLVICQDIAPTLIELAGGRPGAQIQGRSLLPLFAGQRKGWRNAFLIEYWAENAMSWLVGMTYKAVRTQRHKYIHWVNRGIAGELDELYDLDRDPYELRNLNRSRAYAPTRERLRRQLRRLIGEAAGL